MNIIERITQTIIEQFGPTYAVVVYMALLEYKPNEIALKEYGSIACHRLEQMQNEMGN